MQDLNSTEICKVEDIDRGALRELYVVKFVCDNGRKITMDIVNQINIFSKNNKYDIIISKNKPEFTQKDFCGHGYIVTQKSTEGKYVTIISLYGLLIRIESDKNFLEEKNLTITDHIYFCAKNANT
ncbi:DNA-directed RNA polymerase subunit G [Candidatus Acidianus copahuensis]|uniref:DNA-directed RNA polymerase subunit Rpo8 n=1 Tax=Candidatus Acidianus copahuensis TaxID=1160895 RepID=A0A031LJT6_9CREN|nr:DNA-directed RNA polymerase subunit G [Candidatus Acidianus copahuensis]EZQ03038.1 DNA-directed RNA polymerase subunit G [Candidatus Acidianus copahuensis]